MDTHIADRKYLRNGIFRSVSLSAAVYHHGVFVLPNEVFTLG